MENQFRIAAFRWLEEKKDYYGDVFPRSVLEKGFEFKGERITFVGPQGIWKPKVFGFIPLSITTVPKGPYDDSFSKDGFLLYKYRGTDPTHRDNRGLREAMRLQVPLIYFHGIIPNKYLATWPVFIIEDNPKELCFTVAVDEYDLSEISETKVFLAENGYVKEKKDLKRSYITSQFKRRLHQRGFRERVLRAYREQCAFCRLRHQELLDAAHIIPDKEEQGDPIISNGIALCKIHHAAFDRNFLGISPEYKIFVRDDILKETDGPILRYGLQKLHNERISLPRQKTNWPDPARLQERFYRFKESAG